MLFRETELGAARSYTRVQPSKGADGGERSARVRKCHNKGVV